ncbi:MAG: hypothetical protein AAF488_15135 [Planctomycetota bacterium]
MISKRPTLRVSQRQGQRWPRTPLLFAVAAMVLLGMAGAAVASDRTAAYLIVDRVEYLPNAEAPTEAKIHGLYCIATGERARRNNRLTRPTLGFVHVALIPERKELCRNEWKDLERLAGTRYVAAFGSRWESVPKLHAPGAKNTQPDPHPIAGVRKLDDSHRFAVWQLRRYPRPKEAVQSAHQRVKITVENCWESTYGDPERKTKIRYLFQLEGPDGAVLASHPIPAGEDGTTSWQVWVPLNAGDRCRWTCRVVELDLDRGVYPVSVGHLVAATPTKPKGRGTGR